MRTYLGLFFIAWILALLLTPCVSAVAVRAHAYGGPRERREGSLVPRLGGLAIFFATLGAWVVLMLVPNEVRARVQAEWRTLITLLVVGTLVLLLGVQDDLVGTKPWQKLLIQMAAAGVIWWAGLRISNLPVFGYRIQSSVLSLFLTVLWIVAVTNSFNLIDGLDGLAAGIAFFVSLSVFAVSLIQGNYFVCTLAITLAGALLGFLKFNLAPAKIYLGDSGSLYLGFLLAALAIHTSQKSSTLLAISVPFVAFGLPLLDTSLAIVRRFLGGKPIFSADGNHMHHRLLQNGLSPRLAVTALYALAALFSLGSLLVVRSTGNIAALVALLAGVSAWFMTSQLRYEELSELKVYASRAMHSQRRVLANQIVIRKVARQLEQAPGLEASWAVLAEALEALDFDSLRCQLWGWQNGSAPYLPPWERTTDEPTNGSWAVTIPLRGGTKPVGELELRRSMEKERLLFQFSSLLDTLIPAFEKQLERRYDAQQVNSALDHDLLLGRALEPDLLANGKKI